ncbi:MAG: acyl-CoA dehydrogenase family protein [Parasphingopyxis sp.]|uniref:acyl-CoA dehydrogenase family protein n=1 Tax=Parasphingopyxis sp. TaxID=1920299 RepID=UPI0032EF6FBE
MHVALSDEQTMLSEAVHGLLGDRYDFAARRAAVTSDAGYSEDIWRALADDLGIFSMLAPSEEESPKFAVEQMVVMEAAGRSLCLEPIGETFVHGWLLGQCAGEMSAALLGRATHGDAVVGLAWAEQNMRDDFADIALKAVKDGDGWRLKGGKSAVICAPWSDALIVAARIGGECGDDDGIALFLGPARAQGMTMHGYATIDGRQAADIVFDDVRLDEKAMIAGPDRALDLLEAARDRAIAVQTAEATGLLDRLLADTVAYLQQRQQFGQTLASFQALQHRMVDMYLQCELVRAAAWLAALSLDGDARSRAHAASSAKATIGEACRFVGQNAVQLHGGMGMTDDLAIGHYFKRTTMIEGEWGSTDWHLGRLARLAERN